MALKLNKSIKTHIADMAIRAKYKQAFDDAMTELSQACYDALYDQYHNEDFDVLPERAKALVRRTSRVKLNNALRMERYTSCGKERGYGLNVALETSHKVDEFKMPKPVYGTEYFYFVSDAETVDTKAITKLLEEASTARDTLLSAMACYKSAAKMFAVLPWTEQYYPESEKKPKCNIVPLNTIAKANELMGL